MGIDVNMMQDIIDKVRDEVIKISVMTSHVLDIIGILLA